VPQHLPRERRRGHTIKDDCGTCWWRDQCKHGFRAAGQTHGDQPFADVHKRQLFGPNLWVISSEIHVR
jgi:hypothetical protein